MKYIIVLLTIFVSATAQDNPYAVFGHEDKATPAIHDISVVTLVNEDSTASISRIDIDYNRLEVSIYANDSAVSTIKMSINSFLRWLTVDPKQNKYPSSSPYNFVDGNPISRIDPKGDDWYKDQEGSMQFDPKIQSQKDLGEGMTYVGNTHLTKSTSGSTNYRKDGSIFYTNQTEAYNRLWSNAEATQREQFGVITKSGVLVLPDYLNTQREALTEEYGYCFNNQGVIDPLGGQTKPSLATIHTHQDKTGDATPSYYTGDSYGDLGFAAKETPNKPLIVMGHNNQLYGLISSPRPRDISEWKWSTFNFNSIDKDVNVTKVLDGHDLIKLLMSTQISIGK